MALDDDILHAAQALDEKAKEPTLFVGVVSQVDPPEVIFDGSSSAMPCISLDDVNLVVDKRVVVGAFGKDFVIIGAMGNRVTSFPSYDTADPTSTNPGDAWFRTDLNRAYMNVKGVAVPLIGQGSLPWTAPPRTSLGRWFWVQSGAFSTANFGSAGASVVFPIYMPYQKKVTAIGWEITTLAASSSTRVAFHKDDAGFPTGGLIVDLGTVSATSTGLKSFTGLGTTLPAGVTWVEMASQGGDPTYRTVASGVAPGLSSNGAQDGSANRNGFQYTSRTAGLTTLGAPGNNYSPGVPVIQLQFENE